VDVPRRILYLSLVVLFITSSFTHAQENGAVSNDVSQNKSTEDLYQSAESLLAKGDMAGAEKAFLDYVQKMPSDWRPVQEYQNETVVHCWDQDEFVSYSKFYGPKANKKIIWKGPLYSKAYFKLAFIAVERKNFEEALQYLDKGIALEPDHPGLLCEKAYILSQLKRYQEAYDLFVKAVDIRPWASDIQRARALRGAGTALIDLGKLDESEAMFKKSLEIEPGNKNALSELDYIKGLRSK
jgi:tetratricopeptide (TPR) repeat protein